MDPMRELEQTDKELLDLEEQLDLIEQALKNCAKHLRHDASLPQTLTVEEGPDENKHNFQPE